RAVHGSGVHGALPDHGAAGLRAFRDRLRAWALAGREQVAEALPGLVPQPRGLSRGLHARDRQAAGSSDRAPLAPDRRLLVSARRHADRRGLSDGRAPAPALAARPGRPTLSRAGVTPSADATAAIREQALALGFDAVGFAAAALGAEARAHLSDYLAKGYHGDMGWLAARAGERAEPRVLWPEAKTVVVLGMNYGPSEDPLAPLGEPDRGAISVYARGRDYHDIVKSRLKALARFIGERWPTELKVFVDTAPVMEKPLAERGGIGWQGKHTNLVSRALGSWLFLGESYLPLQLEPDQRAHDH